MANKSNVTKAIEFVLSELKGKAFETPELAEQAFVAKVAEAKEKFNLDEKKEAEFHVKIAEIKENGTGDSKTTQQTQSETKEETEVEEVDPIEHLAHRVQNLENAIAKIGVMTGNRAVLLEFGIEPWNPSKKDMSKFNK